MTNPNAARLRLLACLIAICGSISACGAGTSADAPAETAPVTAAALASTTPVAAAPSISASGVASSDAVDVAVLSDSPWGVSPTAAQARTPEAWSPAMAAAGVTTIRGFNISAGPSGLQPLIDSGITVTGILQWSPTTPSTLPTAALPAWRAYVADTIRQYKGQVQHWEVWNEPPNFTADRSPISYGAIVAAAYDAAKAVDPSVQIGLAAKSNHVNFLAQAIDGGAANKFDFITLHPYENAGLLTQGWEGQFMSIAPRVRTMLLDRKPARADVPVWFTEVGVAVAGANTAGVTPQVQADLLTKIYTMSLAQGVARVYWFSPRDGDGMTLGLTTADASPRPSYSALRALSGTLGARPSYRGWMQPDGTYHGFVFDGPAGTVLSAWAPTGRPVTLTLPVPVDRVDPRTGATTTVSTVTITDAPVLLVAPTHSNQSQAWQAAAAANAGKAFAWSGDHAGAASVSLTAGSDPQGVFMLGAPAATVFNGVAEWSLAGRNGASFTVDPAFLSYTTTPIRITISMRAHGDGDPGFNLRYESSAPLASADGNGLVNSSLGWHRVASTSQYEKTWTIPNPRFVGVYGYNFALATDGPSHAQFSIQKVTVSRP